MLKYRQRRHHVSGFFFNIKLQNFSVLFFCFVTNIVQLQLLQHIMKYYPLEFKNQQSEMNNIILLDKIFSSSLIKHKAKIMASNDKNKENNYNYFDNFPVIIKPIDSKFNPFSIDSNDKSNIKPNVRPPKAADALKANSSKSVVATKLQEIMSESMDESNAAYPWHKLLSLPTKQMVVIDRMHSGARRFITLNFGYLVKLTDVVS